MFQCHFRYYIVRHNPDRPVFEYLIGAHAIDCSDRPAHASNDPIYTPPPWRRYIRFDIRVRIIPATMRPLRIGPHYQRRRR